MRTVTNFAIMPLYQTSSMSQSICESLTCGPVDAQSSLLTIVAKLSLVNGTTGSLLANRMQVLWLTLYLATAM